MSRRALIAEVAGLVSSHVADKLFGRSHNVIAVDDLSTRSKNESQILDRGLSEISTLAQAASGMRYPPKYSSSGVRTVVSNVFADPSQITVNGIAVEARQCSDLGGFQIEQKQPDNFPQSVLTDSCMDCIPVFHRHGNSLGSLN